jgi:hypothetical protein
MGTLQGVPVVCACGLGSVQAVWLLTQHAGSQLVELRQMRQMQQPAEMQQVRGMRRMRQLCQLLLH